LGRTRWRAGRTRRPARSGAVRAGESSGEA
jgi:hypothetical protein